MLFGLEPGPNKIGLPRRFYVAIYSLPLPSPILGSFFQSDNADDNADERHEAPNTKAKTNNKAHKTLIRGHNPAVSERPIDDVSGAKQ